MLEKLSVRCLIKRIFNSLVRVSLNFSLVLVIFIATSINLVGFANSGISYVYDGDTLTLRSGEKVRLVQIDTPELSPAECYGIQARDLLRKMVGTSTIQLRKEPASPNKDSNRRLLRYVIVGSKNLNLELVKQGAAAPWFYQGERGKYANQLLRAAQLAQKNKVGLWKECPNTKLDPSRALDTGPAKSKLPDDSNKPTNDLGTVNPGAFCAQSDLGTKAFSNKGIEYTCKASATESRLRWRR
jgi:endonuclease YncB( thermonuclease family)